MPGNIRLGVILAALALLAAAASGCVADEPPAPSPTATAVAVPSPPLTPTATPSPAPTVAVPPTVVPTVTSTTTSAEPERRADRFCFLDPRTFASNDWIQQNTNSTIRWTPDGSQILFDYGGVLERVDSAYWDDHSPAPTDFPDLYAVRTDGSRLDSIVDLPSRNPILNFGAVTSFDLSPDGSRIVYSTCALSGGSEQGDESDRRVSNYEIFVSNSDGTNAERLTKSTYSGVLPAWSPDGQSIAFISDGSPRHQRGSIGLLTIYRLATGSSIEVALPTGTSVALQRLSWSPDSEHIAFVVSEGELPRSRAAYVVGADGSGLSRVSDAASGPAWSPDGTRLAILVPGDEENALALYTFETDGSSPVEIEHGFPFASYRIAGGWAGNLSWSPEGSAILFENVEDWRSGETPRPLVVNVGRCPLADAGTGGMDERTPGLESPDIQVRLVAVEAGEHLSGDWSLGHNASRDRSVEAQLFLSHSSPHGLLTALE